MKLSEARIDAEYLQADSELSVDSANVIRNNAVAREFNKIRGDVGELSSSLSGYVKIERGGGKTYSQLLDAIRMEDQYSHLKHIIFLYDGALSVSELGELEGTYETIKANSFDTQILNV